MPNERLLDVAIIGAGVAGVVHLHYARQLGLEAFVLERDDGVGGLWRKLPSWQDIQMGTLDWVLGPGGRPNSSTDGHPNSPT